MPDSPASSGGASSPALARRPASPSRRVLDRGWQLCEGESDGSGPPGPDAGWLDIGAPLPVAAALERLGRWSLDGPPRDFDAETWWYRLSFDLPEDAAAAPWRLGLDGLATSAQVWLNGEPLLRSENMFRRHECGLAGLRPRANELLLRIDSLSAMLARRRLRRERQRW